MHYIQESLSPGEKVLKISHYHWIYIFKSSIGAMFLILGALATIFFGIIYHYYDIIDTPPWMLGQIVSELAFSDYFKAFWFTNIFVRVGAFLLILMAAVQIGAALLVQATTEIAVTNKRVVLKRGLISRNVEEMRTDFIEGADVIQGIPGRIFGYGQLKIYGTGTESIFLPRFTTDPIGFRRALQMARTLSVQQTEQMIHQMANNVPQQQQQRSAVTQNDVQHMDNLPPLEPR